MCDCPGLFSQIMGGCGMSAPPLWGNYGVILFLIAFIILWIKFLRYLKSKPGA